MREFDAVRIGDNDTCAGAAAVDADEKVISCCSILHWPFSPRPSLSSRVLHVRPLFSLDAPDSHRRARCHLSSTESVSGSARAANPPFGKLATASRFAMLVSQGLAEPI
jgi:hypothetical protein